MGPGITTNVPEPKFKEILGAQMGQVKGIFKSRIKAAKKILLNKFKQRLLDTAQQKVIERLAPDLCEKIDEVKDAQNQIADLIGKLNDSLQKVANLAQTVLGPIRVLLRVVRFVLAVPIPQAVPPGIGIPVNITTKLNNIKEKVLDYVLHAENLASAIQAIVSLVQQVSLTLTAISQKIDAVVALAESYCDILAEFENGEIPEDFLDEYERSLFDLIAALGLELDGLSEGEEFDIALNELLDLIDEYEAENLIPDGLKSRLTRRLIASGYPAGDRTTADGAIGTGAGDAASGNPPIGYDVDGLPFGSDGVGTDINTVNNSELFEGIDGNTYVLEVEEDPNSPTIAPRRFGTARTLDEGVMVLKSPSTFTTDARVILSDIKVRLNKQLSGV